MTEDFLEGPITERSSWVVVVIDRRTKQRRDMAGGRFYTKRGAEEVRDRLRRRYGVRYRVEVEEAK
jgi:hypothetical protein